VSDFFSLRIVPDSQFEGRATAALSSCPPNNRMATSSKPKAKPDPYTGQITFKLPERLPPWPKKDNQERSEDTTEEMFAKIACSPPLGQATVVPSGQSTTFTVLLETDVESKNEWQVALWHDSGASSQEWDSIELKAASDYVGIVCLFPFDHPFLILNRFS
jgi:hypothetical protein